LLADRDGDVRTELRGLHDNLAGSERSNLVLAWLNKTAIASVLREFGTGQRAVSHAGLDELAPSKPIEHLRAILVATSTLPSRDEHLARLERWIARTPPPNAAIPSSGNCCTATPSGTCWAGYGSTTTPPAPTMPRRSP